MLFDCIQCIGTGIIGGVGRQARGSFVTLVGYWGLGIPFSLIQIFYFKNGIISLWLGPLLALIFNSFAYYSYILNLDWNKVVAEAEERKSREKKQTQ